MKFSIIPLYVGARAKIYTIRFENNELDEYAQFILNNLEKVPNAVRILDKQLQNIATKSGIYDDNFKRESPPTHNVFRIEETEEWLRLYCIKYSRVAIVVGGGGIKNKSKFRLSENPELLKIRDLLMKIEDIIFANISSKEIKLTDDGLEGKLNFEL